ncbi:MAG: hypothetical protein WCD86_24525 [Ktedonobacteraceae bacterium]
MFYRVAIQSNTSSAWQWKSTALSSLDTLFKFLRIYHILPQDRLRVFSARSREEMNDLLMQEKRGLASCSVTAAQFLRERGLRVPCTSTETASQKQQREQEYVGTGSVAVSAPPALSGCAMMVYALAQRPISAIDRQRLEIEMGSGSDHDVPYTFTMPISMPQTLVWMRLLAQIQRGELEP